MIVLIGTMTALSAQPADPTPPAAPAPAAGSAVRKSLTPAEMTARSVTIQAGLQEDYLHVTHLKDLARKQKDVIKLNCVNDKLVQIKAQMNIADTAKENLDAAITKASDERDGLFNQMTEIETNVKSLREEAHGCVGEPELSKQEAGVQVDRPELPDDPGTIDPYGPQAVDVDPPAYASPFN